jgi:hypothetical protein
LPVVDDPWSAENNGRNSALTVNNNDPWQSVTPSSIAHVNPWSETQPVKSNGNEPGLSVNIADPWGVGTNPVRPLVTSPLALKSVDNELSEFFGASASKSSIYGSFLFPMSMIFK